MSTTLYFLKPNFFVSLWNQITKKLHLNANTINCIDTFTLLTYLLTYYKTETEIKYWMKFSVHQKNGRPEILKRKTKQQKKLCVPYFQRTIVIFTARMSVFTSSKTIARFLSTLSNYMNIYTHREIHLMWIRIRFVAWKRAGIEIGL